MFPYTTQPHSLVQSLVQKREEIDVFSQVSLLQASFLTKCCWVGLNKWFKKAKIYAFYSPPDPIASLTISPTFQQQWPPSSPFKTTASPASGTLHLRLHLRGLPPDSPMASSFRSFKNTIQSCAAICILRLSQLLSFSPLCLSMTYIFKKCWAAQLATSKLPGQLSLELKGGDHLYCTKSLL